jgi:hypothetical protein
MDVTPTGTRCSSLATTIQRPFCCMDDKNISLMRFGLRTMKLLWCCIPFVLFAFPEKTYSQELTAPLSRFDRDAGSWVGLHAGLQTNGAPLENRFTGMIHYEHRFRDSFGLAAELQLWRTWFVRFDGLHTHDVFVSAGSLMASMKFRFPFRYWTPFLSCGVGTGMGLAPFILFYSFGFEIHVSSFARIAFHTRRTTVQEDSFFFLAGCLIN